MKKILLSAVSLAILSGSALAADLPSRKAPVAPPPPPPPMWTGFYAGLNLGGGWGAGGGNGNMWNLDGLNGGITNNLGAGGNSEASSAAVKLAITIRSTALASAAWALSSALRPTSRAPA